MKPIRGSVYTHLAFGEGSKLSNLLTAYRTLEEKAAVATTLVAADDGLQVSSYRDLVQKIAEIAYENDRPMLFYRGQPCDYRVSGKSRRSSLRPTIFRESWKTYKIGGDKRQEVFNQLNRLVRLMRPYVFPPAPSSSGPEDTPSDDRTGVVQRRSYDEQMWAIIQHYDLWPTPMIDVSQSLQVACSFAHQDTSLDHGYLYVVGLPGIGGSVTYSIEDELCIARLQTICPPKAIRAHFQEGVLVSQFPLRRQANNNVKLANRLVAKFKIQRADFWTDGFRPLDKATLLPQADPFRDEMIRIQQAVCPDLYANLSPLDDTAA